MNTSTLVITTIIISISLLTWLASIWQFKVMISSMMTYHQNPTVLYLFVVIWTAGMAAMMFPAIVPIILVYNRLISSNNATSSNAGNSNTNSQLAYHRSRSINGIESPAGEGEDKRNIVRRLRNTPDIILF